MQSQQHEYKINLKAFLSNRFHPLHTNIQKPIQMNNPFHYHPHPLCLLAMKQVQYFIQVWQAWQHEVEQGKMFGVLVVEHAQLGLGYLCAYSGQIEGRNDWEGFVPTIFDYLQPNGYFKQHEAIITQLNKDIDNLQNNTNYCLLKQQLQEKVLAGEKALNAYKNEIKVAKKKRNELRQTQILTPKQLAQLTNESQFMKAELHRLKKRINKNIESISTQLKNYEQTITDYKIRRKQLSDQLQRWLFSHFIILNAKGEQRNLLEIFEPTPQVIPPAGAGECCAPKLLQYAFLHHLQPICMAEFWWGASPATTIRHHGNYYPACRGKCLPILSFMLQGLTVDKEIKQTNYSLKPTILYEDNNLIAVNKPSGLLSVPGKNNQPSVYSIIQSWLPKNTQLYAVHRLDMATSGILLLAKNKETYHHLQQQFAKHTIQKQYVAVLQGEVTQREGMIDLPLCPDLLDRPRQIVDKLNGKRTITFYHVQQVKHGKTYISLFPKTGRTHQLRIHCAHVDGLNSPIIGDELYGSPAQRLYLHAASITFIHPISGKSITIQNYPNIFENIIK